MSKKKYIFMSVFLSFLMIFSLISPDLARAGVLSKGESDLNQKLIHDKAYENKEEMIYYEQLDDDEYYEILEIEEAVEYTNFEDETIVEELETIENYNLEDYEIESIDNESVIDSYKEDPPEYSVMILPFVLPFLYAVVVRQGTKMLVKQTLKNGTKNLITVRNGHLAGKAHSVTKVKFSKNGFPIFSSKHNYTLANKYLKSTNATQFKYANANLKTAYNKKPSNYNFTAAQKTDIRNGKTPRGYVWHHHETRGKLQLVNKSVHDKTGHTGGKAIWGK